ncbi:unnamed protein product [Linum trigynum]|uniref:Uncharacterized protein n=1 Tax=Linum trigynum TaxID=586398 RepID=A0AAV2D945_9ROSI
MTQTSKNNSVFVSRSSAWEIGKEVGLVRVPKADLDVSVWRSKDRISFFKIPMILLMYEVGINAIVKRNQAADATEEVSCFLVDSVQAPDWHPFSLSSVNYLCMR